MVNNPFVTNGYAGAQYFCDRKKETELLVDLLTNGNDVALISPRRIGKTDLIRHTFAQKAIDRHYYTFNIDIYATSSMAEFVNIFAKSILDGLRPKGKRAWEFFLNVVSSLRSEVTFDISGNPVWSVGIGSITNPISTLDEIFSYLSKADKHCLVAIDEFQQITKYKDNDNIEAALRTYIQRCSNANFIFSGSQRHLMDKMFTSPSKPFYQSVTILNLKPIPLDKYTDFAIKKFEENGRQLDKMVVSELYSMFNSTTSYLQRVMNWLYAHTEKNGNCVPQDIMPAITNILDYASDSYESLLNQIPEKQRQVLYAVAADDVVMNITSGEFVSSHKLISPSSVASAVKGLVDKDILTCDRGRYEIYDRFFFLWIRKEILGIAL